MIICAVLPDFVVALERTLPEDVPTLVYKAGVYNRPIYALCQTALRRGIDRKMSRGNVRAICPDAQEYDAQPKRYARLANERVTALLPLTDRIEIEQSDSLTIWLDVGQASQAEMKSIVTQLQAEFAAEPYRIGIASGHSLARIAAWTTRRNTIRAVAPGQERAFLAPMSLDQFAAPDSFKTTCKDLGLRTMAEFGRLPQKDIRKRFGDRGLELHDLYRGGDRLSLDLFAAPLREEIRLSLETPIEDREIAERVLGRLADHLAKRLAERTLACKEITLTIECEDHSALEFSQALRKVIQGQKAIAAEVLRLLGKANLTSRIEGFQILCSQLQPAPPQQTDFFDLLFSSPEAIADQLAPRHPTTPAYRVIVSEARSYLPEHNITLQSVVAM